MSITIYAKLLACFILAAFITCCSMDSQRIEKLPTHSIGKPSTPPALTQGEFEIAFRKAVATCTIARNCGLILNAPGFGGKAPISNVLAFQKYKYVFYLPTDAEICINKSALQFLKDQAVQSSIEDQLRSTCMEIIQSTNTFRRPGTRYITCGETEMEFILYHYD